MTTSRPGAPAEGRPRTDDRGVVGGAEVLPLAVLVFVVGALLMADLWAIVDGRAAAETAAREAARHYVEAPDATAAGARADVAARAAVAGLGRDPQRITVAVEHPDGRPFGRCVPVLVIARYDVALAPLPLPGATATSFTVTARASERVDPWRVGLPGTATC